MRTSDTDDAGEPAAPELELTKTIAFDKPIKLAGEAWDEMELTEPTAGQLLEVEGKRGLEWTVNLTALNSGIPVKAIRQLPIRVLNEAGEYLVPFTSAVRSTGRGG